MKIRWQKIAPGVYQTDTGRFRAELEDGVWLIFDAKGLWSDLPFSYRRTLRECKQVVDTILEQEATT